jgi:hypothetical protein
MNYDLYDAGGKYIGAALRFLGLLALAGILMLCSHSAFAERIVLAPGGLTLNPDTAQFEFVASQRGLSTNDSWVTVALPNSLLGLELEVERQEQAGHPRHTLSLAYSLFGNLFSDIAPAISVGVRDILDNGRDGRAFYAAATKKFDVSESIGKYLRNWQLDAGYGSSHIGGGYVGVSGKFAMGFTGTAEFAARRWNLSVKVPVIRNLNAEAMSLDGDIFYGANYTVHQ